MRELWQQGFSDRLGRREETVLHFQAKVYNQARIFSRCFSRMLKNSMARVFWEGHEFTRANIFFNLVIPRRIQPPRNPLSKFFRGL